MELTEQRAARIQDLLAMRSVLTLRPMLDNIAAAGVSVYGTELLGVRLRPNEQERDELIALRDRIRARELAENTAKLRELGVEITETAETDDGEA